MSIKKTKIICTLSDLRCDVDFIRSLYENGMDVVRLNSAHATVEGAQKIVDNVRKVSDKIAVLVDTKGPEIRLAQMDDEGGFVLEQGSEIKVYTSTQGVCSPSGLYTNCMSFVKDVPVGAHILIDDGSADIQAIGAGAVNQSVKAIAIASGFLAQTGVTIFTRPSFEDIKIDGEDRTAIRFKITSTQE